MGDYQLCMCHETYSILLGIVIQCCWMYHTLFARKEHYKDQEIDAAITS